MNLSTSEAARLVGCTLRQADHWVRIGLLSPHGVNGGYGSRRRWGTEEVTVLALVARLMRLGMSTSDVRLTLAAVLGRDPRDWPDGYEWGADGVVVRVDLAAIRDEIASAMDEDVTAAAM